MWCHIAGGRGGTPEWPEVSSTHCSRILRSRPSCGDGDRRRGRASWRTTPMLDEIGWVVRSMGPSGFEPESMATSPSSPGGSQSHKDRPSYPTGPSSWPDGPGRIKGPRRGWRMESHRSRMPALLFPIWCYRSARRRSLSPRSLPPRFPSRQVLRTPVRQCAFPGATLARRRGSPLRGVGHRPTAS